MTAATPSSVTPPALPQSRLRVFFRRGEEVDDYPLIWHLSQHNAQLYAVIIALGVPALGYLLPYDNLPKLWIYFVFLMLTSAFWITEIFEINFQVDTLKELDGDASDRQRSELQSLYWGVLVAVLFAAFPLFIYGTMWWLIGEGKWFGPRYGVADVLMLVHTYLVGKYAIKVLYRLITNIQNMLARIRRLEQTVH